MEQIATFRLMQEFRSRASTIPARDSSPVTLMLSRPVGPERNATVNITYAVVLLSILVQGVTINQVIGMGTSRENSDNGHDVLSLKASVAGSADC